MKTKYLFIATVIAILAVSCEKENLNVTNNGIFTVNTQIIQPEQEVSSKTSLSSDLSVFWSNGDAIALYNASQDPVKYTTTSTTSTGEFTGSTPIASPLAYYPYDNVIAKEDGKLVVEIPRIQTYKSGSSFADNVMPMFGSMNDDKLSFTNLMAILKLSFTGIGNVQKIVVFTDTPGQYLSGFATVSNTGELTFNTDGTAVNYVELDCSKANSGDGIDLSGNPTFLVAVPAGTYDVKIRVVSSEYKTEASVKSASNRSFTASRIKPLAQAAVNFTGSAKYVEGAYAFDAITINSLTWAPVNCGYDADHYKYGLLYQYGRKHGSGYGKSWKDGDPQVTYSAEQLIQSYISLPGVFGAEDKLDGRKFYGRDAIYNSTVARKRWDPESQKLNDPCPVGWRVPSESEMTNLIHPGDDGKKHFTSSYKDGQCGAYFNGTSDLLSSDGVFLSVAGTRQFQSENASTARGNGESGRAWGFYWCYSATSSPRGCVIVWNGDTGYASINGYSTGYAFPVRCVKD